MHLEPQYLFESQQIYDDTYRQAEITGAMTESEMLEELGRQGLWNMYDDQLLKDLPKAIEELKVALYDAFYKLKRRDNVAKNLKNKKTQLATIMVKRNEYTDVTCEGVAELSRKKFLIGLSATDALYQPLSNRHSVLDADDATLRKLVAAYYLSIPTEQDMRDMVQKEPWRGYWNAAKIESSLFGCPAAKLSE